MVKTKRFDLNLLKAHIIEDNTGLRGCVFTYDGKRDEFYIFYSLEELADAKMDYVAKIRRELENEKC